VTDILDKTTKTGEIVAVEPHEAEWLLNVTRSLDLVTFVPLNSASAQSNQGSAGGWNSDLKFAACHFDQFERPGAPLARLTNQRSA
jgi:hypothetical protein